MSERRCGLAIIGAGTAGLKAYKAADAAGVDVVIIEKGAGGSTCVRTGCMPSKALLIAGKHSRDARRAGEFGIVADVRVDGRAVLERMRAVRERLLQGVLDTYHAIPAQRRLHGEARFTGPTTLAVGDDTITADAVLIATGGHPIVPESLDPVKALVHTHETIFEIEELPASMAVLGAGPLGIELAQAFARLGVEVTVLDDGQSIGGLGDPEANAAAIAALRKEFALHLGVEAKAEMTDGHARLCWSGAADGEVIVDLVLAATGRPPTLEELDLKKAGLDLDDNGVPQFDEVTRRCGDSAVFIAGDAAGKWRPVLHEAARGGQIAGHVATGGEPGRLNPRFAIAFTEPNLVEVGMPFGELPEGARIGSAKVEDNGRAIVEANTDGLVRLYADAQGTLIGVSIVAPEGEHLGHLVALAIGQGMDAATFADQPWYHPTMEEMLQSAARDLAGIQG